MLSESRNDQHRHIGGCASADRLRDCDNAAGISDNFAEIGDDAAGIGNNFAEISDDDAGTVDIAAKVIPMLNSILDRDWSNSVPGRQFPKGKQLSPTNKFHTYFLKFEIRKRDSEAHICLK